MTDICYTSEYDMPVHKILVVDDRPENLYSLENMLAEDDILIRTAGSGAEALKLAFKEEYSLIMLDVQMPEMDGFEVAKMLKSTNRTRKTPILFVTALSKEKHYMLKGLGGGAIDYLFKPLDPDITRAKVRTLLSYYSQQLELEKLNQRLQQLNQEKNYVLGVASHDLRNPIGNIISLAGFILNESKGTLSADHNEYLNIIMRTGREMLELINDLLDVSRLESGRARLKMRTLTIIELFESVVAENKINAAYKKIPIIIEQSCAQQVITVDYQQIKQVLNNLVSNAIKYSHAEKPVIISAEIKGDQVLISVTDNGQGIPQEEIERLFQPFFTSSVRSTGGEKSTGLGLAIVKKVVDAHGGTLQVSSKEGEGSVFTFSIPMVPKMQEVEAGE